MASQGFTDWDLVTRVQDGDMAAFEQLVRRYQAPVVSFCARMTGSREDAEDIAQESFMRVYRHIHRIRKRAKFSTLLFAVARNLTLNFIRDMNRRGRQGRRPLEREDGTARNLASPGPGPDGRAELAEIGAAVEACLARLSPEHREVMLLREVQQMDYATIARITRCRAGTVKSRIARARERMRELLTEATGGEL